jgi:hypothetical protein
MGMVRIVFPVEADVAVFQSAKPVVGDGDAMRVARQILEHASWSTEGRLEVNDPFELRGCFTQGPERCRLSQMSKLAGEGEAYLCEKPFREIAENSLRN